MTNFRIPLVLAAWLPVLTGLWGQAGPKAETNAPSAAEVPTRPDPKPAATTAAPRTDAPAPTTMPAREHPDKSLHLNFRHAPLSLVLDYLSDAAGFIINKQTEVKGTVDVSSKEPVTADEAVGLLNAVLKRNGYAVLRQGRTLTIVSLDAAKTSDLEVVRGSNPDGVEKSDEVVTQIIPVRYASANQLVNNLQVLLPASAILSVNESANSLILVATKTDIRRVLKIVTALDSSIAAVSSIKVFPLRYADAKQLATVIQQLFSPQGSAAGGGNNGRPQLFGPFGGGPFGSFGGPGGPQPGGDGAVTSSGNAATTKVTAVADEPSNALVVSAPPELMTTLGDLVRAIDRPVSDITEMRVFHLVNADPVELADQFAQLFPDDTRRSAEQNAMPFRVGGGPFGGGPFGGGPFGDPFGPGFANSQSETSDRARKQSRVLAVADPRTSSLIVSAAGSLMPQIARMITQLDANPGRREVVKVWELRNADPRDLSQTLQDLFNRNNVVRNNAGRNTASAQADALATRETQQQTQAGTANAAPGASPGAGFAGPGGTGP